MVYSGVGIFSRYYLISPPQILRSPVVELESGWLVGDRTRLCFVPKATKKYNI